MNLLDKYWNVRGWLVHLRIESPAFRRTKRAIAELIDDGKLELAKVRIRALPLDWQNDPDFIRLSSMVSLLEKP